MSSLYQWNVHTHTFVGTLLMSCTLNLSPPPTRSSDVQAAVSKATFTFPPQTASAIRTRPSATLTSRADL